MCNKPVHFIVSKVEDKASAMMTGKDPAEKVPSGFIESYTHFQKLTRGQIIFTEFGGYKKVKRRDK